jgi:trehalose 6-phosphate synthase
MTDGRTILIASNRGPVSFARENGDTLAPSRGSGGLVTAFTGALERDGGTWIASAMTEGDAELAAQGAIDMPQGGDGTKLRYLTFDPETYDDYYNGISNRLLWFVHHYLWDLSQSPRFGRDLREQWAAYRRVNRAFADVLVDEALAAGDRTVHLVQDYHLSLVPKLVRIRLPDARILHFSHIPFAGSTYIRILPSWLGEDLLAGLLGADIVGFQSGRWADNFLLACRTLAGTRVNLRHRLVVWEGREVRVRVYPVAIDGRELEADASQPAVQAERDELTRWAAGSRLILRADRMELSKNILRGFLAFEALFDRHPQWRGNVRMLAFLDPSREDVAEYREYAKVCLAEAERINHEAGEGGWEPIRVELAADRERLLAAFGMYDVLLVNPIFDGMNLVAKEGPALNRRRGVLVLSENAGAFEEMGQYALRVNPFDLAQTADALSVALQMSETERARRARGMRAVIARASPQAWVDAQLRDLRNR